MIRYGFRCNPKAEVDVFTHHSVCLAQSIYQAGKWGNYVCSNIILLRAVLSIIYEVLVAMGFFPAGAQDQTLKEELQRLAS